MGEKGTEEKVRIFTLTSVDLLIMNLFQEISYRFAATSVLLTYFSLLELSFCVLKLACDLTKHLSMWNFNHLSVSTDLSRKSQVLKAASTPKWSPGLLSYKLGTVSYIMLSLNGRGKGSISNMITVRFPFMFCRGK